MHTRWPDGAADPSVESTLSPLPGPLVTTRFLTTSSWTVEGDLPRSAIERHADRPSSPCSIALLSLTSSLQNLFLLGFLAIPCPFPRAGRLPAARERMRYRATLNRTRTVE